MTTVQGQLFSRDFLFEGIRQFEPWTDFAEEGLLTIRRSLQELFAGYGPETVLNEAATESEIILPVLALLGWTDYLQQQSASRSGRQDVPDVLLFPSEDAKATALQESCESARYRHGLVVLESKRWQRPLDRSQTEDHSDGGMPAAQMLRYLSRVEVISERAIQWGILTNGRRWRLYWQGARSRLEQYLEFDLPVLLGMPSFTDIRNTDPTDSNEHLLKLFLVLFHRRAFLPQSWDPESHSFHSIALAESKLWEERVSRHLGEEVFTRIFPDLARALLDNDPHRPNRIDSDYLEEIRRGTLTLLYRLLFLLHAEDREMLPVRDRRYDDYSLRAIRRDIADRIDARDTFSATAHRYDQHLHDLFHAVANGDPSIGLPPYDGGLFNPGSHPLLERTTLPDSIMADLLDRLSRREDGNRKRWINYRDLSVQHLGSIYERLLEYGVVLGETRELEIRPNIFARKGSGSYYTHDDLVQLVIHRTIRPLIEEKIQAFQEKVDELAGRRGPKGKRIDELKMLDPAVRTLDLRVCDPAMGSGHFLVSLVDYLADQVLELAAVSEAAVSWADDRNPYVSPLIPRMRSIRERILEDSLRGGWSLSADDIDDRQIVRRIILKRMIHGIDKNPMAVELAKVALWLHTFTVGAPLSFLDHHLRCGDSLFGERIGDVVEQLQQTGGLFLHSEIAGLGAATEIMNRISELSDVDIAEVEESQALFRTVDETLRPLSTLLDFWHALRWLSIDPGGREDKPAAKVLRKLLSGELGNVIRVVSSGKPEVPDRMDAGEAEILRSLLADAKRITETEHFLHWEIAFPSVWTNLLLAHPQGGFDAVVGNPPWDRMKLQEVEWFATRRPEIAGATRAVERKRMIRALEERGDPLWSAYLEARNRAETATDIARRSPVYPLLAAGDINLYALFIERGLGLLKPQGILGYVVPSGIAGDQSTSAFFREAAGESRLQTLFDFENKKVFFPDIHASFKFCVFVCGGMDRRAERTECAFYLHGVDELNDPERVFRLGAEDFRLVNPNTGTAPVFRTRRDAELNTAVYRRHPVLVRREQTRIQSVWPIRYLGMFHMTNDSHQFQTASELRVSGYYPVAGNRWRRGEEEYVPLYEGKMVQAYDHRAARVVVHPANIHRPGQPESTTDAQHRDPAYLPSPQFWVPREAIPAQYGLEWQVTFKDVTAPTNMRTMIAAIVPRYGLGNHLPALIPEGPEAAVEYPRFAPLLLANLNSLAFDYLARQKVQGQTLNLYILEQIPIIGPAAFDEELGDGTIGAFIRDSVLKLSYTAEDLLPFAQDLAYEGAPFGWDTEERRHLTARLDALFFHLYGFTREETDYVLDQFPIVRHQDEVEHGRYLTKELVLAYFNAVQAGDIKTRVTI